MLKLKDKSISAYKGDYRPVQLFKNAQKVHGFNLNGASSGENSFTNTYNDYLTIYGKSGHLQGVNLIAPPENMYTSYPSDDQSDVYECSVTVKEDGRFDFRGEMVTGEEFSKVKLQPGTYTASGCRFLELWYDGCDSFISLPATFTLEKETTVYAYFWYIDTTELVLENQYIQIEMGDTASEYSPYIGNLQYPPSIDNMCPIVSSGGSVRVEGANVLPSDFYEVETWKTVIDQDGGLRKVKDLDLLPAKYNFAFNFKPLTTDIYLYIERIDSEGNSEVVKQPLVGTSISNSVTFLIEEGYSYRFWSWKFVENISLFSDFKLRKIGTPQAFLKVEPIINAEIPVLRGIEVTAEDNYNYSETVGETEQYYISDVLKGNKIIRHIGEKFFTGAEEIAQVESSNENLNTFTVDLSDIFETNQSFAPAVCNFFNFLSLQDDEVEGAVLGKGDKKLYLNIKKNKFTTINRFKNWLKARYNGNNPLKLFYVLENPVTEELDDEKALKSYPGFTRIIVENQNEQMPLGTSKIIKIQN